MTTDAIQEKDVSTGSEEQKAAAEETKEPTKSRREIEFDALVSRREQEAGRVEVPPAEQADKVPVTPTEIETYTFIGEDGQEYKVPVSPKYRAKIDGEEVETPVEKITRSYQKGAAADHRLEEATRRMKEAEQLQASLAAKASELTAKEQEFAARMAEIEKKRDEGKLSEDAYRKNAERLINALTDAEDPVSEVAAILKGVVPQDGNQGVDKDALLKEAEQRIDRRLRDEREKERQKREKERQEREAIERREINEYFRTNYGDIANDVFLMGAAKNMLAVVREEHPDKSQLDIVKMAGDRVRERIKKMSAANPKPTPRAVSTRASIGEDEKVPTRDDTLNEMRRTRGQPLM